MIIWQKSAKVGKTDRFSADVSGFSADQTIVTASMTSLDSLVTVGGTVIDGDVVSALITGVTAGSETILIDVATATRSRCETVKLLVEDC